MPAVLVPPGSKHWRVLELSLNAPWFMVTLLERESDICFNRDLLISWDSDLRTLLDSTPKESIAALHCIVPSEFGSKRRWDVRSVQRVWCARDSRSPQNEALIFEDADGEFSGFLASEPTCEMADRRLLMTFHEAGN